MLGNVSQCQFIFQAHKFEMDSGLSVYRLQGVALPKGIFLNHTAFGILEKRAAKLVMVKPKSLCVDKYHTTDIIRYSFRMSQIN